jgi:hypothetical protein
MDGYVLTQRKFTDVETNEVFHLYMHPVRHEYKLVSHGSDKHCAGSEVNGFYLSAHSPMTLKINKTKLVELNTGEFYTMKEGEVITHKKYCGFTKFTKVK